MFQGDNYVEDEKHGNYKGFFSILRKNSQLASPEKDVVYTGSRPAT